MPAHLDNVIEKIEQDRRVQLGLLVLITLLAAGLRFYKLGTWSFWIDEVFTMSAAENIWYWLPLRMPFNLLAIHYTVDWLGVSEWSMRLFPALVGIITIPLLYFPIRRLFGAFVGLTAVSLLTLSPWHIYWSQNARFYVLLLLLYNAGLLYALLAFEEKKPWLGALGGLLLILALREKFTAVFFAPVLATFILTIILMQGKKPAWLKWWQLLVAAVPLLLYGAYDLYSYLTGGYSAVRGILLILGGNPIDSPIRILILILFNIGLPVVALVTVAFFYQISLRDQKWIFFLIAAILPVLLVIVLSEFMFITARYAFITLPSWLILAALLVDEARQKGQQVGHVAALALLAVIVFDMAGGHLLYYQLNHGNRLDWRSMLAQVEARRQPGDLIATTRPPVADYYVGIDTISLVGSDQEISPELVVESNSRYWFVVDSEAIWSTTPQMRNWIEANAQLVDFSYLRTREQFYLQLYYYDPTMKTD